MLYYKLAYKDVALCLSSSINAAWKISMAQGARNYRQLSNRMRISIWQKMSLST